MESTARKLGVGPGSFEESSNLALLALAVPRELDATAVEMPIAKGDGKAQQAGRVGR